MTLKALLCGAILAVPPCVLVAEDAALPFRFDVGSGSKFTDPYCARVDSRTHYSRELGYGLLTRNQSDYRDSVAARLAVPGLGDGVTAPDSISFRVDTPPGQYVLEILMDGGRFTEWKGSVTVNGKKVAGPLQCSSTNTEAEAPPPFWGKLLLVETSTPFLIVTLKADGQLTTLAAIACYPVSAPPVRFESGNVVARAPLKSPNGDLALRLINRGRILESRRLVDAIPDTYALEKGFLLFAIASRMEVESPLDLIARGEALLRTVLESRRDPVAALGVRLAELLVAGNHFLRVAGWEWGGTVYAGHGLFDLNNIAGMCFGEAATLADHPLYPASLWLQGKAAYWLWVEQHSDPMIRLADSCFGVLSQWYPDHPLLTMYRGKDRFEIGHATPPPGIPRWAFLQKTIVQTILDVIHYWVQARQAENGEFGGKYDDDVEMLRWWPIARLAYDDSLALLGMKRLVDGIWHSGWIEKGFSKKVRDVEHSSEPVADTQPMMIGFDYGNPLYVERCMQSVKGIRDLWTGINAKGHRHFRSSWYSATAVDTTPPKDCDLAMNTRTVKAAQWLVWYNRHPFVLQFLKEWGDAWLEDCLRTDNGKPAGIVPAAIRFSDDAIGGHADNWHHPGMFWGYYNYNGGSAILQQLLLNTILLGDRKYLAPIELSLALVRKHESEDGADAPTGSELWAAKILQRSENFWEVIELWRLTTGDQRYDDLIVRAGSPYLKFLLSRDKEHLTLAMTGIVNTLTRNIDLIKTEGYFTDRVELRDMREGDSQVSSFMEAMLLGASLNSAAYPFNRVSWTGFDTSLSAIVVGSDTSGISLTTFNHGAHTLSGSLIVNDLRPGSYRLAVGSDGDDDGRIDTMRVKREFSVAGRRTSVPLTLQPLHEELIEIRAIKTSLLQVRSDLPDLAVTGDEVHLTVTSEEACLEIPVHNIGSAAAPVCAYVVSKQGDGNPEVARGTVSPLAAPLDLEPKISMITVRLPDLGRATYVLILDPDVRVPELNKANNSCVVSVEIRR
jgi:hypothetical protein